MVLGIVEGYIEHEEVVRWKEIKCLFTLSYLDQIGSGETNNPSARKEGKRRSGSDGFVNMRSGMRLTLHVTLTLFISTRSSMGWRKMLPIGFGLVFTVLPGPGIMQTIGERRLRIL